MDAFFAAIEERDNSPHFTGLPIVVGADPLEGRGRGVVSTANYKAREFGIRSATPISTAWRMAKAAKKRGEPETVFLPVNMGRYVESSAKIMETVRKSVPVVEQVSVDEAYLDLSFTGSYKKAKKMAQKIKKGIKEKEGLTASIGIGPNKLISKIASDMQKPDGLTVVRDKEAESFLAPLAIRVIPGIGPKTEGKLKAEGINTIEDLLEIPQAKMQEKFGKWGTSMWERARGIDESPVVAESVPPKSVGEQETFSQDTKDSGTIFERLNELSKNVMRRFHSSDFRNYKTVVVTVRFADFETKTRTHTLKRPASSLSTLNRESMKLMMPFLDKRENPKGKLIRLIGVRVEKLN